MAGQPSASNAIALQTRVASSRNPRTSLSTRRPPHPLVELQEQAQRPELAGEAGCAQLLPEGACECPDPVDTEQSDVAGLEPQVAYQLLEAGNLDVQGLHLDPLPQGAGQGVELDRILHGGV